MKKVNGLVEKLPRVSTSPGVYLMKDSKGDIIYVGKALNLRKRVTSYFIIPAADSGRIDIKTGVLINKISDFETIITETENEALILESSLIKKHKPRYNIILKDDKRYPSLRLNVKDPYPYIGIVRKIKNDGAQYFGPYSSAYSVRNTLKTINRTFKLRKCKTRDFINRTRPCLNYQMNICLAPCCLDVDKDIYIDMVKEVALFLNGKSHSLLKKIKNEMASAAGRQDFEKAAFLRDKMFAIEKTLEKQVVVTNDFIDRDVIAVASRPEYTVVTLLTVRGGFLIGSRHFCFSEILSVESEIVRNFIMQYYMENNYIPREILIPVALDDVEILEKLLGELKKLKVRILFPKRGNKKKLLKIATQNAENELNDRVVSDSKHLSVLSRLQKMIKMDVLPSHIECFDNSNISGSDPVSSMVVFKKGKPEKTSYRRYKIKTVIDQNDYAYMSEVIERRYGKGETSKPYPDLLIVDGGKGQLNIAVSVLKKLGIKEKIAVIGIAKKDEGKGETSDKIYKFGRANHVNIGRQGDLLLFLQYIRDEAHRFAISFHRLRRSKTTISSALDDIPGIGKKRKEILLKHFGGIKKIMGASVEELIALPGISIEVADNIKEKLSR